MRLLLRLGLGAAIAWGGACSLLNAPAEVIGPSGGGGGHDSGTCHTDADCPTSDVACFAYHCAGGGLCQLFPLKNGTKCDDGHACTTGDACDDGKCTGAPMSCPGKDACNIGVCDEHAQGCIIAKAPDGTPCDDGDLCTDADACEAGACKGGGDACAKLVTECVDAVCDGPTAGCSTSNKADGTTCGVTDCSDGTCQAGHCALVPKNDGKACDDKLFCTVNDTCHGAYCIGDARTCPAAECERGLCDEDAKTCTVAAIPDGSPCDPGDACIANAYCHAEKCVGGDAPKTFFSEKFADGSAGWELGPEWEIGPATASSGQQDGNGDPDTDVTTEGGVAGVEIGGNALVDPWDPVHPPYYLTSPPVDTDVNGAVYLTFYRWLNSDVVPYMRNTVEATSDGHTWVEVWASDGPIPITDSTWTFQAFDITAFKSKTTRVRFGFSIGEDYVYRVSSWNLDDVKLQSAPCSK